MDINGSQILKPLVCLKHKKTIEQIYLKDDQNQKLVCFKCCKENKCDYEFLIDIDSILQQNEETIFENLPPGLNEQLHSQLLEQNIQQGNKEEMIQLFSERFDVFIQNIVDSLQEHKKMVINHIGYIDDQRLDIIKQYNEISAKKQIRDLIISSSNNQEVLNSYLNDLIESKKTSQQQDEKKIEDLIKIHKKLSDKFDIEYIKNNMLALLEKVKQLNLIKQDLISSQPNLIIPSSSLPTLIIEQPQQLQSCGQQYHSSYTIPVIVNPAEQNNNIPEDISLLLCPIIETELKINSLDELASTSNIIYHQNIRFYLENKCLSGQNIKQLSDFLYGCKNLKELYLDLENNKINDSDIEYLCKSLQSSTKLTKLIWYLQVNNIGQTGIDNITELLSSFSYMTYLELGFRDNKNITDQEVQPLIKIISTKNQLNFLCLGLSSTKIGGTTLRQISDGLKSLSNLKTLRLGLSNNNIADNDAVTYLSQGIMSLKSSFTEIKLYLQNNQIQNKAAQDIFNSISSCSELKILYINLENNQIEESCKEQLRKYKETLKTTCKDLNDIKILL